MAVAEVDKDEFLVLKLVYVVAMLVISVLVIILLWIWLANGHRVHALTLFTFLIFIYTILIFIAWKFAANAKVEYGTGWDRFLNGVEIYFGLQFIPLLLLAGVLFTRGTAGGS